MHDAVKTGDEIVTIGGMIGEVVAREDEEITLKVNDAGMTIKILIYAVQSIKKQA